MRPTLINGVVGQRVDPQDRGLHYGDGLFETISIRDGRPCLWTRHLERLRLGAQRLRICCPPESLLRDELGQLADGVAGGVVKIVLTRGAGGRGYRIPEPASPTRILSLYPAPTYPEAWQRDGIHARLCQMRLSACPALAGIKHLNRLDQVLARLEWDDPAIAEGLMQDDRGHVTCGTMTNLFVFDGERILTPGLERCGIAGTARGRVIAIAAELGIPVREAMVTRDMLGKARGLFLTNAVIGVWPVRRLDADPIPVTALPRELIAAVLADVFRPEPR